MTEETLKKAVELNNKLNRITIDLHDLEKFKIKPALELIIRDTDGRGFYHFPTGLVYNVIDATIEHLEGEQSKIQQQIEEL